jgi:hypothetical protein
MTRLVTDDDIELFNTGLTCGEVWELALGPSHVSGSLFSTREELRDAWERGRGLVMKEWAKNGRRPMAFWQFESPISYPGYERERSALYEAGMLGEEEASELVEEWRREFERAQQSDFFTHSNGKVLGGAPARRAHYRWVDIPRSLIREWSPARQRQRLRKKRLILSAVLCRAQEKAPG